ncbi:cytochrome b [Luteibacter flocculans]|uniref:Cytochrome b n=1 Tax=Luteibacter flocculans TaxID=2780091 RepID=A0ABY4SXR4_9GAMM|nr:cytochrome b [Luteibacter flocculans]URL57503.1 cytochrome b [Luteibacter flocculans]
MHRSANRYGSLSRWTHWLTVVAIVAAYVFVDLSDDSEGASAMMRWHYLAGLAVLVLLIPRMLARLSGTVPPIVPTAGKVTKVVAQITHLALYAFLLVQPVLGILQVNYAGELVTLPWGGWSLPSIVAPDPAAREAVGEVHETLGEIFYWVIGAHILASLWHHFIRRDNTLRRMV